MTFTILTPVLNAAHFMPGCLDNVLSQDCPEAEHLIVDGGSKDGTLAMVQEAAERHPGRVRLLDAPGTSQSEAMNQGIAAAKGAVLGILNADDFYQPGVFKRAQALLEGMSVPAFVCANCNVLNEAGEITKVNKPSRMAYSDLLAGRPYPWNPSAYFYHKVLHDLAGGYDEADPYTMDFEFLLRALPHARVRYVDEVWGNFRFIPGAKTFEQGSGIHDKVEALRLKYLAEASPALAWRARAKRLYDVWSYKITRRLPSVAND